MPAFFSPSKQHRYADAIAASFFESRQTAEARDLLVGEGVAAAVTISDVTKRRILVVDVGAKIPAAARTPRYVPPTKPTLPKLLTIKERKASRFLVGPIPI